MKFLFLIYTFIYFFKSSISVKLDLLFSDIGIDEPTPLFTDKQPYYGKQGNNFYAFYQQTQYAGKGITVHLVDDDFESQHEDLVCQDTSYYDSLTEVHGIGNRGIANAGILLAGNNTFGIVGMIHEAKLIFYRTDAWTQVNNDGVNPGDIVIINHVTPRGPLICDADSRSVLKKLLLKGAIIVIPAGSGNRNLDNDARCKDMGEVENVVLVTSSSSATGERVSDTNYASFPGVVNIWGTKDMVTLGYGDLQNAPVINRKYTSHFKGDLALVGGTLAAIQGFMIQQKNKYLNAMEMIDLIHKTSNLDGLNHSIGYRPDLLKMVNYVNENF